MTTPLRLQTFARAAMLGLLASQSVACSSDGQEQPPTETADGGAQATSDSNEEAEGILSSKVVPGLTLEAFSSDCQEAGGVVEEHSHCGGFNTCQGFSYDTGTEVYTEHTCHGYNTCAGFSCVVPS